MNTMDIIPQSVIQEAKGLVELYGNTIKYLGVKGKLHVYMFEFPEQVVTGFPFVFLYDQENDSTDTITGLGAVDIISEFLND